jgi:hypothetical protein
VAHRHPPTACRILLVAGLHHLVKDLQLLRWVCTRLAMFRSAVLLLSQASTVAAAGVCTAASPCVTLNNGVEMPL